MICKTLKLHTEDSVDKYQILTRFMTANFLSQHNVTFLGTKVEQSLQF